jgi:hypothetical protein
MASPALDDDLGLAQCVEDLAVEQFVASCRSWTAAQRRTVAPDAALNDRTSVFD